MQVLIEYLIIFTVNKYCICSKLFVAISTIISFLKKSVFEDFLVFYALCVMANFGDKKYTLRKVATVEKKPINRQYTTFYCQEYKIKYVDHLKLF